MNTVTINNGSVYGFVTIGMVTTYGGVDVNEGGNIYRVSFDNGENRVTVAHRGFPRKVKANGPTGRRVLARVMFPMAA